jgi:quercetin dioxygenase-like cupin family protein
MEENVMSEWGCNGWAVHPGAGQRVDLGPHWLEVLVRGVDVDQALGAFVFTHDPIAVNPPHAHGGFMKIAFVLDGEYSFRVGDATFDGGPGTVVVVPSGSQHSFTTQTGGKMLFVCSPAGNEELFLEIGKLGPGPDSDKVAEINERFQTFGLSEDAEPAFYPDPTESAAE